MATKKYQRTEKTLKEEARLFKHAQNGCRASLNALMKRHEGLVQAAVRRGQCRGELSYDEALQAGREGLWRAILKYDPGRGIAFSSYAWPSISRRMWLAAQRRARIKGWQEWAQSRLPEPEQEVEPDPAHLQEEAAVKAVLGQLVEQLPQRLRQIIVGHYGLNGQSAASYRQLAPALGMSHARIGQLHLEALAWLGQPARSDQLRALLGRHTLADYHIAQQQSQKWLRQRGGRQHDGH